MNSIRNLLTAGLLGLLAMQHAAADRIKDVASVAAVRSNQLIGYGLVVGLPGTGDDAKDSITQQTLKTLLNQLGAAGDQALQVPGATSSNREKEGLIDVKNVAAVMVTAELPGFAKPGQKIDVNVSAIGKAKSLQGGNLLMTALRGVDGEVYALAQGPLSVTGVEASSSLSGNNADSKVSIGVPTSGRIPGGAQVEREVANPFDKSEHVVLNVRQADFTTTSAIVDAINKQFGAGVAQALDSMSVAVRAPQEVSRRVAFVSQIENMVIQPGEPPARVIVNSRTGTVVINRAVRVSPAAVSHGTISVAISVTNEVVQPNALAAGQTTTQQNAQVAIEEPRNPMFLFQPGVDLRQIVDAVNQVGASPSALIAILEALKSSGSLRAELVVI